MAKIDNMKVAEKIAKLKKYFNVDGMKKFFAEKLPDAKFDSKSFVDICRQSSQLLLSKIKKVKLKKTKFYGFCKKVIKKLSDSWKVLLTVVPLFLFFYYVLGSKVVEEIDVHTQYKLEENDNTPFFRTTDAMAFLIKREVDDKMWTPNLPIIFPAYILDNMPNFQKGIIAAVKDITGTMRYLKSNTEAQKKDINEAYELLSYPPDVWIMSRKGKFNLAPSSNSQYRKAGGELRKFTRDGIYKANGDDLLLILKKISVKLQKITLKSESCQQENSSKWSGNEADDLFYYNKGYSFALWQISKVLCHDYKEVIINNNFYEDWTRMSSSLQKAAEYSTWIVRNGKIDSIFTPNHLLVQNYYLLRSITAALKISNRLAEHADVD